MQFVQAVSKNFDNKHHDARFVYIYKEKFQYCVFVFIMLPKEIALTYNLFSRTAPGNSGNSGNQTDKRV